MWGKGMKLDWTRFFYFQFKPLPFVHPTLQALVTGSRGGAKSGRGSAGRCLDMFGMGSVSACARVPGHAPVRAGWRLKASLEDKGWHWLSSYFHWRLHLQLFLQGTTGWGWRAWVHQFHLNPTNPVTPAEMLKAGQLHSCRPPAGPLEAMTTHLCETRNSVNRGDLVKIIPPSLLTEVFFKAHPARILWSSCPQQSSGPQSIKYPFFPVSPPLSSPLILSYPHGKQFFTTVKEKTFLTLCLPQASPPSLTEKKKKILKE